MGGATRAWLRRWWPAAAALALALAAFSVARWWPRRVVYGLRLADPRPGYQVYMVYPHFGKSGLERFVEEAVHYRQGGEIIEIGDDVLVGPAGGPVFIRGRSAWPRLTGETVMVDGVGFCEIERWSP